MPRPLKQRISLALLFLLFLGGGIFWFTQRAQGVTRTWDGGGTDGTCGGGAGDGNKWTCAANWSADTVPTSSDTAVFDGTSSKNATIDANLSGGTAPAGISINAGYGGIITQATGITITVGASNFSQAAGTFTGGNSAITVNGTFTLSGGTFTSTTGTLSVVISANTNETIFLVSGGTFQHNNGTVTFAPAGSCARPLFTVDVVTSLTLYNVIVNATNVCGFNQDIVTASGDTIIAANNFTHTDGALYGTWEVQGNVVIGSGADGGTGTLTYTGTGAKTYTYTTGGTGPHLRVNNVGVSVSAAGGTTDLKVSLFSLLDGTVTAPTGTMTIGSGYSGAVTFFLVSGGTFNHNNGTVSFSQYDSSCSQSTLTVDVVTSFTLYNVIVNAPIGGCGYASRTSTASGDTIIAANNFTHTDGALYGTWEVQGNVVIGSGADGGTATLSFTGTSDQTYTDQGGNEPDGNITINKPVGTAVNLASNADWNAASQTTTITSGILNLGAYNLYTGGTLTVGSNGVLHDYSTGDLILGGGVSNAGIIRLESGGTCGYTDNISITSSAGGTQRSWSGSGVYTLWDVSLQDQGGTAPIQVNSGTSVSGNGSNFVFSSACNVINNNAGITSGLVGYWPMEENSGTTTADMSGNGNTGTLTSGPTWTTGRIGNAVNFDGSNDTITEPQSAALNTFTTTTISAWVRTTTVATNQIIVRKNNDTGGANHDLYQLDLLNANARFSIASNGGGVKTAVSAASLSTNTWYHLTGIYDGSTVTLYINGVPNGTPTAATGTISTGSSNSLYTAGCECGTSAQFSGQIDEVRIYNRALSVSEIQTLYANTRPSAAGVPSGNFKIQSGSMNIR